jgi:CheY-like chemotaxis protein/HPt (histidine-containing phosphotransfer) domain-containing protein
MAIAAAEVQGSGPQLAGLRVLAAEDVALNRVVLRDLLEQEGAHVLFAYDGRQSLELLEARGAAAFDVVLMDIQMPIMDGFEATRRLLAIAPELPVIGLTAHALAEERDRCLAAGMVAHATKPIDRTALITTILAQPSVRAAFRRGEETGGARESTPPTAADVVPAAGHFTPPATAGSPCGKPTIAAAADEYLIDWSLLFQRFPQREAFIDKLLQTVLDSQADLPAKLRDAAQGQNMAALAFLSHGLKGTAGNLAAGKLQELAHRLDERVRACIKAESEDREVAAMALQAAEQMDAVLELIRTRLKEREAQG